MKSTTLALAAGLFVATSSASNATTFQVGLGDDQSYLIIESPNIGVRTYEVSYTYDPVNGPLGTTDLLVIIAAEDTDISFSISDFGDASQPNEFLNSISFNGITESNDFSPGGTTWAQWAAGGQAGAENTFPFPPAPVDIPDDSWTFGSGLSVNYRLVEPGSSDALVFGPNAPVTDPIPEPSSTLLIFITGGIALLFRR